MLAMSWMAMTLVVARVGAKISFAPTHLKRDLVSADDEEGTHLVMIRVEKGGKRVLRGGLSNATTFASIGSCRDGIFFEARCCSVPCSGKDGVVKDGGSECENGDDVVDVGQPPWVIGLEPSDARTVDDDSVAVRPASHETVGTVKTLYQGVLNEVK